MTVLLYRPSLDFTSGAGQLMLMQLLALRAAGVRAEIGCERGAFRFLLRSGTVARRLPAAALRTPRPGRVVVDHGLSTPNAALVFVHNVASEANIHLPRADWLAASAAERSFFAELAPATPVVANSRLVKAALVKHFALAPERVIVHYPGFRSARFNRERCAALRARARSALGFADAPLVGLITSGDFAKRGLDLFLAAAQIIAAARPEVRFLVVGSKELPADAREHALVVNGKLAYRPKQRDPERWFAALDLFLYPARFEEFGMVVSEAQAVGVPVVTSRVVGAAECLPPAYERWLADRPDAADLAQRALALLGDDAMRGGLARLGAENACRYDDREYARATVATIAAIAVQNGRLR
jgi:glycosyltransferase involved in cell wall biosynthesis